MGLRDRWSAREASLCGDFWGKSSLEARELLPRFAARAMRFWDAFPDLGGVWDPKTRRPGPPLQARAAWGPRRPGLPSFVPSHTCRAENGGLRTALLFY